MSILSLPPVNTAGDKRVWQDVNGGSALVIAEASQQVPGLTVVIADSAKAAAELESELRFFLGEGVAVLHFPDWETLPYDIFSPHQDIVSERLRTLSRLPQTRSGVVIVPVGTLMHRLPPTEFVNQRVFEARRNGFRDGDAHAAASFPLGSANIISSSPSSSQSHAS